MSIQVKETKETKVKCGIYFISDGSYIKIGKSEDIDERLPALSTGNPNILSLVAWIECPLRVLEIFEKKVQKDFIKYHHHKEWFNLIDNMNMISEYVEKEAGRIIKKENRALNNFKVNTLFGEVSAKELLPPCGIFPDHVAHSNYAFDDPRNFYNRSGRSIRFEGITPAHPAYAGKSSDKVSLMYICAKAHVILDNYVGSMSIASLEFWLEKAKKRRATLPL